MLEYFAVQLIYIRGFFQNYNKDYCKNFIDQHHFNNAQLKNWAKKEYFYYFSIFTHVHV